MAVITLASFAQNYAYRVNSQGDTIDATPLMAAFSYTMQQAGRLSDTLENYQASWYLFQQGDPDVPVPVKYGIVSAPKRTLLALADTLYGLTYDRTSTFVTSVGDLLRSMATNAPLKTNPAASDALVGMDGATGAAIRMGRGELQTSVVRGNRTIAIGDSITAYNTDNTNKAYGGSWFTLLCYLSDQRVQYQRAAGVAGETLAQMQARFAADVVAYAPDRVIILGGTNDTGNNVPLATSAASIVAMVGQARAAGILPILCTIPPRGSDATIQGRVSKLNAWIKEYARRQGLTVIDFHAALVDGTTGGYQAAYNSGDNVHPSIVGHKVMAQYAATVLAPLYPARFPYLAQGPNDTANLVPGGGMFASDTNADGVADFWNASGTATNSRVQDANALGYWQQRAIAGANLTVLTSNNLAAGWAVGDRFAFACRLETLNVEAGGMEVSAFIKFNGAAINTWYPYYATKIDGRGTVYAEDVIPAATTSIQVGLVTNTGTGTAKIAQATFVDLTALGLA